MSKIKFEDYKSQIKEAIQDKINRGIIKYSEDFSLVDGFIYYLFCDDLNESAILSGKTLPCVMIIGKESGLTYTLALKLLLPNIEI